MCVEENFIRSYMKNNVDISLVDFFASLNQGENAGKKVLSVDEYLSKLKAAPRLQEAWPQAMNILLHHASAENQALQLFKEYVEQHKPAEVEVSWTLPGIYAFIEAGLKLRDKSQSKGDEYIEKARLLLNILDAYLQKYQGKTLQQFITEMASR